MSSIEFPPGVTITRCERQTNTVLRETPHGVVREEWSSTTDYGRSMVLWRARRTEQDPATVITGQSVRAVRRASSVALPASGRRRRVPANVTPGRYSW